MYPVIDNDWLGNKNELPDEQQHFGNVAKSWQWREMGINPSNTPPNKTVLENIAEDILVQKQLNIRCCDLPGYPRSTFLMVFSPDGTKVASTHGNHNVYVSELASGKHVRILKGHPRTPWCIAFHPSHPQLIGSGCLGGQVRVWDLSGGSEVWTVENETVIASIAFHPRDQLLVIATFNELYFWDWSQPAPFTKVRTNSVNDKVRYVAFDSLGYKLITGISVWSTNTGNNPVSQNTAQGNPRTNDNQNTTRRETPSDSPGQRPQDNTGSAQEMIVNSYQNLVQRYDSLVRNYQRLFMARHQLNNTTNTTDRGTDPMETDGSTSTPGPSTSSWSPNPRPSVSTTNDNERSRDPEASDSGDEASSGSRLLNFDVLSINPSGDGGSSGAMNLTRSFFGSRTSAFQRINENAERSYNLSSDTSRHERPNLLPNPFSTTNRSSYSYNFDTNAGSSRTSVFAPYRARRLILSRRRNLSAGMNQTSTSTNTSPPSASHTLEDSLETLLNHDRHSSHRDSYETNSSSQISPDAAQTINESLDLIRDILRDSGTRLLNLITNMSLSTLASVERNIPRGSRSEDGDSPLRSRLSMLTSSLRRDFFSSESDSDADRYMEVNILRARNSSFEDELYLSLDSTNDGLNLPTDRMEVELNADDNSTNQSETNRFNVSTARNRFRVRSHSTGERENNARVGREESSRTPSGGRHNAAFDPDRPSTSRDTSWIDDPLSLSDRPSSTSSGEAYRKVKTGVNALHKHTVLLTDMWLRGTRTSMRDLRNMWENLRRRVLSLQRQSGAQDVPSYYTRSLSERCNLLSELTRNLGGIPPRSSQNNQSGRRNQLNNNDRHSSQSMSTDTSTSSSVVAEEPTSSSAWLRALSSRRTGGTRCMLKTRGSFHRRVTSARWRVEDSSRNARLHESLRRTRQHSRPANVRPRSVQLHSTRNQIRMRAMQVLSIMFNMMMGCLEERGLSQLIIVMLRTLKKALALTCLMLMTNRLGSRDREQANTENTRNNNVSERTAADTSRDEAAASTSTGAVSSGADGRTARGGDAHDSTSSWPTSDSEDDTDNKKSKKNKKTLKTKTGESKNSETARTQTPPQRWSNRLAVQIAAANRNTSTTARYRREDYLEMKRLKALHRTNPTAHPLLKKRVLPPVSAHRIPVLRYAPRKPRYVIQRPNSNTAGEAGPSRVPPAGPSEAGPPQEGNNQNELMNDFEHRVNLFRIAHMHALRMSNAARNRYRRLPTIRVYAPSSVREMFSLQSNNNDAPSDNVPNNVRGPTLRRLGPYRPHILTTRNEVFTREPRFDSLLNNVAVPIVQVNDLPVNEPQRGQPPRLPRVHDYLQPIILAQNALVVEDGGPGVVGSGLGGLLEISTHRVQAWDFTAGLTPDIADNTKNVVVQKCRIHNDASIDISKDGRLLVALLPVARLRHPNHWLGVYSLEWGRLGQCLHTAVLEQSAVSVALSPTARHLAVGLGSRRVVTLPHARNNVFALLYKLSPLESSSRTNGMLPIKELEQNWEQGFTSLNCLRWAPQPGQGLVYANNTGQLIIMS